MECQCQLIELHQKATDGRSDRCCSPEIDSATKEGKGEHAGKRQEAVAAGFAGFREHNTKKGTPGDAPRAHYAASVPNPVS